MLKVLLTYGIFGSLRLVRDLLVTRICFRTARLMRLPVYIRGRSYVKFGRGFTSGVGLRVDVFPQVGIVCSGVVFGEGCQVNDYVHIGAVESVTIGKNSLIASKVFITDHNHGSFDGDPEIDIAPIERSITSAPVNIGDSVWLGESVIVLPGVTIGNNAIVGAGSVVTTDIPANAVAVGNPAKVIKVYDEVARRWRRV